MSDVYSCLACGRKNPVKGINYTNKYCNNKCQQDHRKRQLAEKRVTEWLEGCGLYVWKEVPDYIRNYLITTRGHKCEVCSTATWRDKPISLIARQRDKDPYKNSEDNLLLICPNCNAQE